MKEFRIVRHIRQVFLVNALDPVDAVKRVVPADMVSEDFLGETTREVTPEESARRQEESTRQKEKRGGW